jgi:hypothetical protein
MDRRAKQIFERAKEIHKRKNWADMESLSNEQRGELLKQAEDELLKNGSIEQVDQS